MGEGTKQSRKLSHSKQADLLLWLKLRARFLATAIEPPRESIFGTDRRLSGVQHLPLSAAKP